MKVKLHKVNCIILIMCPNSLCCYFHSPVNVQQSGVIGIYMWGHTEAGIETATITTTITTTKQYTKNVNPMSAFEDLPLPPKR